MFGWTLREWTMLPADDVDLHTRIDVLDPGVVVPIAMPLVESGEHVLMYEIPWHLRCNGTSQEGPWRGSRLQRWP